MGQKEYFTVSLRLLTLLTFVGYLFAGASLSVVAQTACHCQHAQAEHHTHGTSQHHKPVQAGDSCPLSSSGRHCDNCHTQTGPSITLCPGGKLHHEQGEIVSIAKFVGSATRVLLDNFPHRLEELVPIQASTRVPFPPRGRPPTPSFLSV